MMLRGRRRLRAWAQKGGSLGQGCYEQEVGGKTMKDIR